MKFWMWLVLVAVLGYFHLKFQMKMQSKREEYESNLLKELDFNYQRKLSISPQYFKENVYIDNITKRIIIIEYNAGHPKYKIIKYSDVLDVEVISNNTLLSKTSALKSLAGGAALGLIGAIAGGSITSTHEEVTKLYVRIITSDVLNPMINIILIESGGRAKNYIKECERFSNQLYSTFLSIIKQNQ